MYTAPKHKIANPKYSFLFGVILGREDSREGRSKTSYKSAPIAIFRGKDFGRGCSLGDVGAAVTLVAPHQIV